MNESAFSNPLQHSYFDLHIFRPNELCQNINRRAWTCIEGNIQWLAQILANLAFFSRHATGNNRFPIL